MLELMTPKDRAKHAHTMAASFELVRHRNVTYIPAHYETGDTSVPPAPLETMWKPLDRTAIQRQASDQFNMLFASDGELAGFDFMVAQNCRQEDASPRCLLVRTKDGLKRLDSSGALQDPTGAFVPNTITPMLNVDQAVKDEVFDVLAQWLDSEDEARALLRHLATSLAPGWSAIKYVLLLGEGRNGKSVLLKMMHRLYGTHNVSNVTRQAISEKSPSVLDLNGKLLNIVYDGQEEYLKDSGAEKTLIAGEPFPIRRLYESTATLVQTNALFIEGLQKEPKSKDKSTALQKRLVRFQFPNVYPQDHAFERHMLSEPMLGAFLSLLIDHYVNENEVAVLLAPTQKAIELQLEHMYANSLALQFLKYIEENDPLGVNGTILGAPLATAVQLFQAWRVKENDLGSWSEPDVAAQLQPLVATQRHSVREGGKVLKVRVVTSLKPEAEAFIKSVKEEKDGPEPVVED